MIPNFSSCFHSLFYGLTKLLVGDNISGLSLFPHYLSIKYNEGPSSKRKNKKGFKALSCHYLCRLQYTPGGSTQICSCSSPAILPYLHLCSIVHDTDECVNTLSLSLSLSRSLSHTHCTVNSASNAYTHRCPLHHTEAVGKNPICLVGTVCLAWCRTLSGHMLTPTDFFFLLTSSLVPLCVKNLCCECLLWEVGIVACSV